ncbi:MAG: 30S ribosomal protein S6 [Candidatus Buchananbacteria bacterium]|jgi:small subunit ribosomal protein S6
MQNYELLYIIPNQYTDDEAKKIKEKVDAILKSFGAALGIEEDMGKKKLAYPIGQVAHGYYFLNEFELEDGTKLAEINNNLRLDKEILRAQIIVKQKLTPEQIEKAKKHEAARNKMMKEAAEKEGTKQAAQETATHTAKTEDKKVNIKNLDEKLEEILKSDDLV